MSDDPRAGASSPPSLSVALLPTPLSRPRDATSVWWLIKTPHTSRPRVAAVPVPALAPPTPGESAVCTRAPTTRASSNARDPPCAPPPRSAAALRARSARVRSPLRFPPPAHLSYALIFFLVWLGMSCAPVLRARTHVYARRTDRQPKPPAWPYVRRDQSGKSRRCWSSGRTSKNNSFWNMGVE